MPLYRIDPDRSALRVETRAKGLLAKLAHDLSIDGRGPSGSCTVEDDRFTLELELPVAALRVAGVRKGDRVDTATLSASDRDDIQHKLRDEVLAGRSTIVVRSEGAAPDDAPRATVRKAAVVVRAGRGEQRVHADVEVTREGERLVATGKVSLSLESLRIAPVKGPLGAFRVDDTIDVHAHLELLPA